MIRTNDVPRGSGKTTKIIEKMKADDSLLCIVPVHALKNLYPKELHDRIIVAGMDVLTPLRGKYINSVILDEGFVYRPDIAAQLYYFLGYNNIQVEVYGTIE